MNWIVWSAFVVFVLLMLAVDLGLLQKKSGEASLRGSILWVSFCIALALLFSGVIYYLYERKLFGLVTELSGADAFQQFLTAWLLA